ncbi:hypothetical protein D3Y57_19090 [Sphingomonas paeninsulae]|uniref:Uncharacterized protein n=2 Tax=Sphingomonas paeninsulae TaxID=2319844 RepID=A0A494TKT3_SPHPE|nr:hypothetical protein D3Y57_19090 [Sphingomonas paeninsulae]
MPTPVVAGDHIHRTLGLFIGRGRKYQCSDIETGTGIPERTVSAWLASDPLERRAPKGWHLLTLCGFLGEVFTSKIIGLVGQGAHSLDPEANAPGVIIAQLIGGTAEFAIRGADHIYCNVDRGALEPVADQMIATLTPFSTKGR